LRLVLDTCVIVSAFRSLNGASRGLLNLFDLGRYEIPLSPALLLEYEDVLTRPEHMQVHNFSIPEVGEVLDTMAARAVRVSLYYDWKPQLRATQATNSSWPWPSTAAPTQSSRITPLTSCRLPRCSVYRS
jgi:hypothetical protein